MSATARRYGNDNYWCFVEDGWNEKEVAIWSGEEGREEIIARAIGKYCAKFIVDALINYNPTKDTSKFGKHELSFLEFVCSNCVEPYATMASNAILWNDRVVYDKLKDDFPKIYS